MMDLDLIGKHCTLRTCNELDFLPIQCSCLRWFCSLHISPDNHDCSTVVQRQLQPFLPSTGVRARCASAGCSRPSLDSAVSTTDLPYEGQRSNACCPGCRVSFCVDHRHRPSHSCTDSSLRKEKVKNEAARAILAQNFPPTLTSTSHTPVVARRCLKPTSDTKKVAQLHKVNLMKMRHRAVPGDPKEKGSTIPVGRRLYINVRLEMTGQPPKEIILWFQKTIATGKALDLIADHFMLSTFRASPLYLKGVCEEVGNYTVLRNDLALSEQIEDASNVILSNS
ncbi:hypothetical protein PAXRUDRAFT_832036 [Paxillus rubicundulus Ve08.2h10]|uniref:AN1-type domain-containing protein n=1 Tax=Paxillus rubicundulus Ve08.2h10 TaxID=930991 RepID=A0A0D0DFX9_9AGAM|nr:hypothetical protein PAXRUDRAFT_832036 [Paxillus rubicundulus Ve08.2h10]